MRPTRGLLAASLALFSLLAVACDRTGTNDNKNAPDAANWRSQIKGGSIEVGVLSAEGTPGLKILQQIADGMKSDYSGANVKLTFANTQARPAIEQRWRAGDPLDVDYGMFDGTNPALLDWADDGLLLDLKPYLDQQDPTTGKPWLDQFSPTIRKFMAHPQNGRIYAYRRSCRCTCCSTTRRSSSSSASTRRRRGTTFSPRPTS